MARSTRNRRAQPAQNVQVETPTQQLAAPGANADTARALLQMLAAMPKAERERLIMAAANNH